MFLFSPLFLDIFLLEGVESFEEGVKNLVAGLKDTYTPQDMLSSLRVLTVEPSSLGI